MLRVRCLTAFLLVLVMFVLFLANKPYILLPIVVLAVYNAIRARPVPVDSDSSEPSPSDSSNPYLVQVPVSNQVAEETVIRERFFWLAIGGIIIILNLYSFLPGIVAGLGRGPWPEQIPSYIGIFDQNKGRWKGLSEDSYLREKLLAVDIGGKKIDDLQGKLSAYIKACRPEDVASILFIDHITRCFPARSEHNLKTYLWDNVEKKPIQIKEFKFERRGPQRPDPPYDQVLEWLNALPRK